MSDILTDSVDAAFDAVGCSFPSVTFEMTNGDETGAAILASSVNLGQDVASTSGANESRTYAAKVSAFPTLSRDSLVRIGDDDFIITSLRASGGALFTFGTSEPLNAQTVLVSGARREDDSVREIKLSVGALLTRLTDTDQYSESYGRTDMVTFVIVIRGNDWIETSNPLRGDVIQFDDGTSLRSVKISDVKHVGTNWILKARGRA